MGFCVVGDDDCYKGGREAPRRDSHAAKKALRQVREAPEVSERGSEAV